MNENLSHYNQQTNVNNEDAKKKFTTLEAKQVN